MCIATPNFKTGIITVSVTMDITSVATKSPNYEAHWLCTGMHTLSDKNHVN